MIDVLSTKYGDFKHDSTAPTNRGGVNNEKGL